VCIAFYAIVAIMVVLWLLGLTPTAPMRQYFWPLAGFVYFLGLRPPEIVRKTIFM
jgi:hypothetical protein